MDEMNLIQTVAQQIGIFLERYLFEERMRSKEFTTQIERMHQAIFHSLNRSFYTPLEGITEISHELQQPNWIHKFVLLSENWNNSSSTSS